MEFQVFFLMNGWYSLAGIGWGHFVVKLLRSSRRGIAGGWVQSPSRTLGGFGKFWSRRHWGMECRFGRPARGEFWRGMKFPSYFNRAAQTGVFSTVWKFFPSCLFPLAVHHAVPKHREDMEGNRPPHLSHLLWGIGEGPHDLGGWKLEGLRNE